MLIAEIGLNHLGSVSHGKKLIDEAIKSNISAITIQIRENDFYKCEENAKYKLSLEQNFELIEYAKNQGGKIGVALANKEIIKEISNVGVDFIKILSWDFNNYNFIKSVYNHFENIYISSGMSSEDEIIKSVIKLKGVKYKIIHTSLSYDEESVNLKAIESLRKLAPDSEICYGHHCASICVLYASISFEPYKTFLYIKGNKSFYPDEKHAIGTQDLSYIVENFEKVKVSLGHGKKTGLEKNYIEENR
ncbi:MAG: hypothetical protein CMO71_05790 [Verrucomicrobiales bacterium]|nr:hypothetical protein [Verrucomicrobiales bacterium]